jgi:hypothetical protein
MSRRRTLMPLVVACLALAAPAAASASTFAAPTPFPAEGPSPASAFVAAPNGAAGATWTTDEGGVDSADAPGLTVALRGSDGTVRGPFALGRPSSFTGVALAVDRHASAIVGWQQRGGGDGIVSVARCARAGCGTTRVLDRHVVAWGGTPAVTTNAGGRSVVLWRGAHGVRAAVRVHGAWTTREDLGEFGTDLAVATSGDRIIALWSSAHHGVRAAVLGAGTRFSAPRTVGRADVATRKTPATGLEVVAGRSGYVAAWQETGKPARVTVVDLDRLGHPDRPRQVALPAGAGTFTLAAGPTGRAVLVTQPPCDDPGPVSAAIREPGQGFGVLTRLTDLRQAACPSASAAVDAAGTAGTATIAWYGDDSAPMVVRAARAAPFGTPMALATPSPTDPFTGTPRLAAAGNETLALWGTSLSGSLALATGSAR